jgi:hypothetical protein
MYEDMEGHKKMLLVQIQGRQQCYNGECQVQAAMESQLRRRWTIATADMSVLDMKYLDLYIRVNHPVWT